MAPGIRTVFIRAVTKLSGHRSLLSHQEALPRIVFTLIPQVSPFLAIKSHISCGIPTSFFSSILRFISLHAVQTFFVFFTFRAVATPW